MSRSSVENGDPVTCSSPVMPTAQAVVHYDHSAPSYPPVKTPGAYVFKNLVFL